MPAVTPAYVKSFAPEFSASSDLFIQTYIDQASLFHSSKNWGTKSDVGLLYLTLHLMTMWFRSQPVAGAAAGTGGLAPGGAVKWVQSDNQQVGYASPTASLGQAYNKPGSDAWWEATSWGQAYQSLRRTVAYNRVLPGGCF